MTPGQASLAIYKGQTFDTQLILKQRVSDTVFTPIDLTNYAARMMARISYDSPVLLTCGAADGTLTVAQPTEGLLQFNIPAAQTALLDPLNYDPSQWIYDVEIFTPDGYVERVLQGSLIIYPEVTRP